MWRANRHWQKRINSAIYVNLFGKDKVDGGFWKHRVKVWKECNHNFQYNAVTKEFDSLMKMNKGESVKVPLPAYLPVMESYVYSKQYMAGLHLYNKYMDASSVYDKNAESMHFLMVDLLRELKQWELITELCNNVKWSPFEVNRLDSVRSMMDACVELGDKVTFSWILNNTKHVSRDMNWRGALVFLKVNQRLEWQYGAEYFARFHTREIQELLHYYRLAVDACNEEDRQLLDEMETSDVKQWLDSYGALDGKTVPDMNSAVPDFNSAAPDLKNSPNLKNSLNRKSTTYDSKSTVENSSVQLMIALKKLAGGNNVQEMERVWEEMEEKTVVGYEIMLREYCLDLQYKKVVEMYFEAVDDVDGMKSRQMNRLVLEAMLKLGYNERLVALFISLKNVDGVGHMGFPCYSCALIAYCKLDDLEKADDVLQQMKDANIKFLLPTYACLIRNHSRMKNYERVLELYAEMKIQENFQLKTDMSIILMTAGEAVMQNTVEGQSVVDIPSCMDVLPDETMDSIAIKAITNDEWNVANALMERIMTGNNMKTNRRGEIAKIVKFAIRIAAERHNLAMADKYLQVAQDKNILCNPNSFPALLKLWFDHDINILQSCAKYDKFILANDYFLCKAILFAVHYDKLDQANEMINYLMQHDFEVFSLSLKAVIEATLKAGEFRKVLELASKIESSNTPQHIRYLYSALVACHQLQEWKLFMNYHHKISKLRNFPQIVNGVPSDYDEALRTKIQDMFQDASNALNSF